MHVRRSSVVAFILVTISPRFGFPERRCVHRLPAVVPRRMRLPDVKEAWKPTVEDHHDGTAHGARLERKGRWLD